MEGSSEIFCASIKLLNEDQFNAFIVLYNKALYRTEEVFISNGPYDGGKDLSIFVEGHEIKRSIQITIQKDNLKNKILSDVKKAYQNIERYSYLSRLDFYSKEEISNETQNICKVEAETKYGIDLSFYDCRRLASMVESFPVLRRFLKENVLSEFSSKDDREDVNTNLIFDVLSRQPHIVDMKHALVETCFLSIVFRRGSVSLAEIEESLDSIFCNKIKHSYYEHLAGVLQLDGKLIVTDSNGVKCFRLSQDSYDVYSLLDQQANNCDVEISNAIRVILSGYQLNAIDVHELYSTMNSIYDSIFGDGLTEIKSEEGLNKAESQEGVIKQKLEYFFRIRGVDEGIIDRVIQDVVAAFESNSILGKESASRVLIKLFNDNKIWLYGASNRYSIVLDTPVLIRWVCILFNAVKDYKEPFFQYVSRLKTVAAEKGNRIHIETMDGYVFETAVLMRKAIRLKRFEKIMRSFGESKNVFFNYYLEADKRVSYGDCEGFITQCLDLDYCPRSDNELDELLFRALKDRLANIGISSIHGVQIDSQSELWRDYEMALLNTSGENKSQMAKERDLQAILHMARDYSSGNEPCIVTSDASFGNARDYLDSRYEGMCNWLIYTPQNLARALSLEDFKINPAEVSSSIRIAIENTIHTNPYGKGLVDVVSEVTSNWSSRDMKFANAITRLKKSLHSGSINGESSNNAIDELLIFAIKHYSKTPSAEEILLLMFDDKEYLPKLKGVLQKYMPDFHETDRAKTEAMIKELDSLLDEVEIDVGD